MLFLFFFFVLPFNLLVLPLCVVYPPFKKRLKRMLKEDRGSDHGEGRAAGTDYRRRGSVEAFYSHGSARLNLHRHSGFQSDDFGPHYFGKRLPEIKTVQRWLGVKFERSGIYLLETPGVCINLFIVTQLIFVALYISVELPTNRNLNPEARRRFVLMLWAASTSWLGIEGMVLDFTSWQARVAAPPLAAAAWLALFVLPCDVPCPSARLVGHSERLPRLMYPLPIAPRQADWLNILELPGNILACYGLIASFTVHGDDEWRDLYYFQADRYGEWQRAAAVSILLSLQARVQSL